MPDHHRSRQWILFVHQRLLEFGCCPFGHAKMIALLPIEMPLPWIQSIFFLLLLVAHVLQCAKHTLLLCQPVNVTISHAHHLSDRCRLLSHYGPLRYTHEHSPKPAACFRCISVACGCSAPMRAYLCASLFVFCASCLPAAFARNAGRVR